MSTSLDELAGQVEHLLDGQAIRDCVMIYARGIDRFDRDLVLSAYHPDAIDDHGKFLGSPTEFWDWAIDQHSKVHLSLVTGGAGVLGGYAIQLAKVAGLVVAADARDSDVGLLEELGADVVVPRGAAMSSSLQGHFADGSTARSTPARIGDEVAALVRDDGTLVGVRSTDADGDGRLRRIYVSILTELANTSALDRLQSLMDRGDITPRLARRLAMRDVGQAHHIVAAGGLRGRVVLELAD